MNQMYCHVVCTNHEWVKVVVTATNAEPTYLYQCRLCGLPLPSDRVKVDARTEDKPEDKANQQDNA